MDAAPHLAHAIAAATLAWLFLLPLAPLVGAATLGIAGKWIQDRFGRRAVHAIAVSAMAIAATIAVAAVAKLAALPADARVLVDHAWTMLRIGDLRVDFTLTLDALSAVLVLVITLVGTLIHVYATAYMAHDKSNWRFFAYLNLFVFFMLTLVLADNLLLMFVGWEGVGLASLLLIGFWYEERKNASAGTKAFVVNRIGDWGMLAGVMLLFWGLGGAWSTRGWVRDAAPGAQITVADESGEARAVHIGPTLSFRELREQVSLTLDGHRPLVDGGELPISVDNAAPVPVAVPGLLGKRVFGVPLVFLVCLLLFIGATGKSAQLPLYVWLPDAMAGPTPVSALIHAATMVTAGVYLVARFDFLYALSPGAMTVVTMTGALTALFAATIAAVQYDIKKVLAYSTVSQLGFMFIGVGSGATWAGIFHLVTHACFKATLFLGAGSVIHAMHELTHHREHVATDGMSGPDPADPQDLRNMGGLGKLMPLTRWTYFAACLAIAGLPVASGFFSKDEALWQAFASHALLVPGWLPWSLGALAATLTSMYCFRSYYMAFHGRAPSEAHEKHVHETPRAMTWVLVALGAASIVVGPLLGVPKLWTGRAPILERWLDETTSLAQATLRAPLASHGAEWLLLGVSVVVALTGWAVAWTLFADAARGEARLAALHTKFAALHKLLYEKYRVDELYGATFVRGFTTLASAAAWFDRHIVDGIVAVFAALAQVAAALTGAIDRLLVDGAVNALADATLGAGRALRRVQTGRINQYVLAVTAGVVAVVLLAYLT